MVERIINGTLTSTRAFEEIYPFNSRFLDIHGHQMHCIDQGQGDTVVMVHGNPTWSFYYRHAVEALSPDFRCIVPDHIGCGLSDKPAPDTYAYTLENRVKDLDTLISRLAPSGKINLIVHDWGGMIGLAWALDHLDRVNKMVVTNTSGFLLPGTKRFPLRLWLIKYLNWFGVPAVLGANVFARAAIYMAASKPLPAKVKTGLLAPYNSWKNRIATLKFVQDIPIKESDPAYQIAAQVDRNLQRLKPEQLLFLWGAKDFVFDLNFHREFKNRFPKAQSRVYQNAGHYLFEDRPGETMARILQFLKTD